MSFIDLHTNVSLGHTKITGLGGEKLWLCPTLGGDKLDISGNGNHGTYNGGMGTVADTSNGGTRAYSFDGSDDYIEVADDDVFSFTNGTSDTAFTVSMWVNITDHSDFRPLINKTSETISSSGHEWNLTARPSGDLIRGLLFGSSISIQKRLDTTTGLGTSWKHIVFSSDGTNLSFHLDGSLISATQSILNGYSGMTNQSKPVRLGAVFINDSTYKDFFYGLQDDIRIFDRALTTSEITHLASKRGVLGTPRNPVIKKRRIFYAPTAPVTTTAKAVVLKKPKPSYATGYAKNASESANPNLWKGLVGAWMPSFGVTGETLKDVSGNKLNAVCSTGLDWSASKFGKSIVVADDNIQTEVTELGKRFSFAMWVKVDYAASDTYARLIAFGNNNYVSMVINKVSFANKFVWQQLNGYSQNAVSQTNVSGEWQHIAGTYDFTVQRLFVDGNLEATLSRPSQTISDYRWYLGGSPDASYSSLAYMVGEIGNAYIYNRVLSATEIKQLYLNPSAPFLRKQQTVGISTAQAFNPYWGNQATQLAGTLQ